MHKVLLFAKLYPNYLDNIQLSDDYKHIESEIMRNIGYNLLSITLIRLYFLHTYTFCIT